MRWAFIVLLGACSYGILSTFAKLAYAEGFTPAEVIGSEMFFGVIIIWVLALFVTGRRRTKEKAIRSPAAIGGPNTRKGRARKWPGLLAVGCLIGLTTILYFSSVSYVPASLAIVLLFQFTWIGVLFESVSRRQWPSRHKVVALIFLFIGTILTGGVLQGEWQGLPLPGLVLGVLAAVSFATYINLSGVVATDVHPVLRSSVMLSGALLLVCIVFPPAFLWNGALLAGLWRWGLLLAFFGCVVPTVSFAVGVPRVGGGLATILSSAELPTAILMSALVLGEEVQPLKWLGVAVILIGIVVGESGRERSAAGF